MVEVVGIDTYYLEPCIKKCVIKTCRFLFETCFSLLLQYLD